MPSPRLRLAHPRQSVRSAAPLLLAVLALPGLTGCSTVIAVAGTAASLAITTAGTAASVALTAAGTAKSVAVTTTGVAVQTAAALTRSAPAAPVTPTAPFGLPPQVPPDAPIGP